VTKTPLPSSQHGVGRCRRGTKPAIRESADRQERGGSVWIVRDPRARPAPATVVPLDLGGAPKIFRGSGEPGGPGIYSQRSSPKALIQRVDWRGSESIRDLSLKVTIRSAGKLGIVWPCSVLELNILSP
jgi:hypothetical protein